MRQPIGPDWDITELRSDPGPAGSVLTVLKADEVIVWLIGEIDVSMILDLDEIATRAPAVTDRLTIDGSRVTFCDSALLRFIAIAAESTDVTVRRPSHILVDILRFSGLSQTVSIDTAESEPR